MIVITPCPGVSGPATEEAPVVALTPDCDPDLVRCGSAPRPPGGSVRSAGVLLVPVAVGVLAVTGAVEPGAVAVLAG